MELFVLLGLTLAAVFLAASPDEKIDLRKAIFAGGCFWCMEPPFRDIEGVVRVTVGYTGGRVPDPGYQQVTSGSTGHYEAVEVVYDPKRVRYEDLLEVFWRQIDPTDSGGQFADRGTQYHTAIFYQDEEQRSLAEESKKRLNAANVFSKPIVTAVLPAKPFYPAEEYHQDYAGRNPMHYSMYKTGSGRSGFLAVTERKLNGMRLTGTDFTLPPDEELRRKLTPLQYKVSREDATEPPFANEYWDNKEAGIYVDIVSGEPLFSSRDKFDSGTGWPSFTRPLAPEFIVEKEDRRLFTTRIEVRSRLADSHLGHVFKDGPEPTGLRYCINSAALRFVPKENMAKEGYGDFLEYVAEK